MHPPPPSEPSSSPICSDQMHQRFRLRSMFLVLAGREVAVAQIGEHAIVLVPQGRHVHALCFWRTTFADGYVPSPT